MKYCQYLAFLLVSLMSLSMFAGTSPVNLRLEVAQYDASTNKMLVNVQIEYDQAGSINLASQNYRFFYDSDALELRTEDSRLLLNQNYSDLKWETTMANMDADHVNQLDFDGDLGFANFSIALLNNIDGSQKLTSDDGWVSVAQLVFEVKDEAENYTVVWGRQDVTDLYATAFVEIGEWKDQGTVELLDVRFFGDLNIEKEELLAQTNIQYSIGPNPTSDFLQLQLQTPLRHDAKIIIQDISGQTHINTTLSAGMSSDVIDLSDLASATYILRVFEQNQSVIETTVAVAR